jgi:hypothetical protein
MKLRRLSPRLARHNFTGARPLSLDVNAADSEGYHPSREVA